MRLPRSLTSRLVLTSVALVALVAALIAVATTVAMRDYLTDQLDAKVLASAERAGRGGPDDHRDFPHPDGHPVVPDDIGNQQPGTLVVDLDEGTGFLLTDRRGDEEELSAEAIQELSLVPADAEVHQVDVPGHGSYRAVLGDGGIVTGLPTEEVDDALGSLVRWELALVLGAVVVAGVAANAVVRRQLRPLSDVAATAHTVAQQPLEKGDVGTLARVPDHLTDPETEVGQVGQALNTLLQHVESSLDARHRSEQQVRQFVADASHELRTPLTTIAGYTELARRRKDPEATATALAKVEEEAARMTALVEDLLLLARLDSGRPLAQEPVDLTRLLLEAVEDARVVAPQHHWRLELPVTSGDAVPVEVTGDSARLHQAVTNLLTNARKYTPPGTTVTVAVRPDGFEVRDDGPGFPPDLVPVAFERFSRGDASRHRQGGVGLGLAIVQAIVVAHGGAVTLTSEPGATSIEVSGLSDNPWYTGHSTRSEGGGDMSITTGTTSTPAITATEVERAEARTAHNYHPLPVVLANGEGAWMTDVDGRRFLDLLAGYSALNFGHSHPRLVAAAHAQLDKLTLTSRAFIHDAFADFCAALGDLCGKELVLPMNTGAEAVETAIKVSRKWGYEVKGVPADQARIIVASGNFHGRTTTIVGFSDDPDARDGFGPFTPGFDTVAYGDIAALEAAIARNGGDTVAVLIEPIQGEGGVVIPPEGYLRAVRDLCTRENVLFAADEIQAGLGRTGRTFACDHEGVTPDLYILGKALGGGIVPVSAVVGNRDVLGVLKPGQHGSTFGGNPLACAVGHEVVQMLATGEFQDRAAALGEILHDRLAALVGHGVVSFRTRGLWAGIDIDPALGTGRDVCERLMARGVLAKDTHGSTIRLAPPLVISEEDLHWGLDQLAAVLA